jgi:hypothetical protein
MSYDFPRLQLRFHERLDERPPIVMVGVLRFRWIFKVVGTTAATRVREVRACPVPTKETAACLRAP